SLITIHSSSTTSITTITTSTIITTFTTTCTHIITITIITTTTTTPVLLFIPPPVDRREDIPEAELPPRKRLCPTAPTLRYEVGESLTAALRPTGGHRADYRFIGTMDAKIRRQRANEVGYGIRNVWVDLTKAVEEVTPTTLEGVNARVAELTAVQEQDSLTGVTDDDMDCTGFITTGTVVSGIGT
ncbi:hypothetical protein Tco_0330593, partial [Tanacetum coccineum]